MPVRGGSTITRLDLQSGASDTPLAPRADAFDRAVHRRIVRPAAAPFACRSAAASASPSTAVTEPRGSPPRRRRTARRRRRDRAPRRRSARCRHMGDEIARADSGCPGRTPARDGAASARRSPIVSASVTYGLPAREAVDRHRASSDAQRADRAAADVVEMRRRARARRRSPTARSRGPRSRPSRADRRHQALERVGGRRQQLTRRPRVAEIVRAFAEKPEPVRRARAAARASGSRLPARGPRRPGAASSRRPIRLNASAMTSLLIASCRAIGDVAVETAAAQRIAGHGAAIAATAPRSDSVRVGHALRDTRSMRACTRSPGIAPETSTTWPSWRAIIAPPAAGLSIVSGMMSPGFSMESDATATTSAA